MAAEAGTGTRRPLHVIGWPAFSTPMNPYNSSLYAGLQRLGVIVKERSVSGILWSDFDILHVHWPNFNWPRRTHSMRGRIGLILHAILVPLALLAARARGRKVVWTIHNLRGHDARFPNLASLYDRCLVRLIDAHISLSESARAEVQAFFPHLAQVPGFTIPHGSYCAAYGPRAERHAARQRLGIPATARVALSFGNVRSYKNSLGLVYAYEGCGEEDVLVVAGQPFDASLRDQIRAAAKTSPNAKLFLERIPPEDIPVHFGAADIAIISAETALNSGTAILALSFGLPILAFERGTTRDLQAKFGKDLVQLYAGELSWKTIEQALDRTQRAGPIPFPHVALETMNWPNIAAQTHRVFTKVARGIRD